MLPYNYFKFDDLSIFNYISHQLNLSMNELNLQDTRSRIIYILYCHCKRTFEAFCNHSARAGDSFEDGCIEDATSVTRVTADDPESENWDIN